MYQRKNDNELKYLYIDLINNDKYIDIEKLKDFIALFDNKNTKFIFDYNCLEYQEIDELLSILILKFKSFVLKCDKFSQIEKLESLNCLIDELRVKMSPSLSAEKVNHKITNNTKLFSYLQDLNKDNILNFGIDLFVNGNNTFSLKETLKILSNNGFESKILFDEYPLNSYYCVKKPSFDVINDNYQTEVLFDNILKDDSLKISNKDDIMYILHRYMHLACWKRRYPIQICLGTDFKLKICNKIDVSLDVNPFECFENGNLKEDIFQLIKHNCNQYCLGCNCEDFILDF